MVTIILMDGMVIQANLEPRTNTNENTVSGGYTLNDFDEMMAYDIQYNEYAFSY